jgi:hypothetical protein
MYTVLTTFDFPHDGGVMHFEQGEKVEITLERLIEMGLRAGWIAEVAPAQGEESTTE